MSASSPAGSENLPRGPMRHGMMAKFVRFVVKSGVFAASGLVLFYFVFAPGKGKGRLARRLECLNNARQVGLAFHNYHAKFGCFPPAYVANSRGQRLLSWRVLLLPYLEKDAPYKQFHLDEPWDSPHNRELVDQMPKEYRCPEDSRTKAHLTNYVVITGSGTVFDGTKSCRLDDIAR